MTRTRPRSLSGCAASSEPTGDDAKNWADASLRQHVEQTRGRIEEIDESLAVAETLPDMRYPCAVLRWTRRIHVADLEGAEAFLAELNSTSPGLGAWHTPAMPDAPATTDPPTARTRVRRLAERGRYDSGTVHAILDEGLVAHVGFTADHGPCVLPMAYTRVGDVLYLHGATGNAMLRALDDADVCVTVTLLDGLVLSRSAFHHSMNYRSVVVFGRAVTVTDVGEKEQALAGIVDHMVVGRSAECRPPTADELRATRVARVPLTEASAKVRTGPAKEDAADLDPPVWWGGVIPVTVVLGEPEPDSHGGPSVRSTGRQAR